MTTDTQTTIPADGAVIEIPLAKLRPSPKNARKTPHTEAAIAALAASIAAKGVLQPPTVEPERDETGEATGFYLVTIGEGRRLALQALAKRKAISKAKPIRCIVDLTNDAHEISLDENVTRSGMHPADEFEAFQRVAEERGYGPEEIAARFGVSATVVRQRLKLAVVSPALIRAYRDEALTLDQLMAFAVSDDHARQEQVYEGLGWNKSPAHIRHTLMETQVRVSDRRAVLVGPEAYLAAGGAIVRDLFSEDQGGWITDPALLDQLVAAKLADMAEDVREREGWKWAQPSDQTSASDLRRVYPRAVERSEEDQARATALSEEYDALVEEWQHEADLPEEVEARFKAMDAELEALGDGMAYDPDDVARGGVFLRLEPNGEVRFERGFIRPEDEPVVEPEARGPENAEHEGDADPSPPWEPDGPAAEAGDDDDAENNRLSPLSDRLVADLTAQRTAGLRDTVADHPDVALLALIHALALQTFYRGYDLGSCLDVEIKSVRLAAHAPGIDEGIACRSIEARHAAWAGRLPRQPGELWAAILALEAADRMALMAHCVSLSVNAIKAFERRPGALAHAERLAEMIGLDMRAYWTPTVVTYLGRVSKAHIAEAVREGCSPEAAERIAGLKKGPMGEMAEEALAGRGWLPPLLRTASTDPVAGEVGAAAEAEADSIPVAAE